MCGQVVVRSGGGTLIHFQKHSIVQLDDKIKLEFFC